MSFPRNAGSRHLPEQGFTLTELLVVLAASALLLALLLSSLQLVRNRIDTLTTTTNLRVLQQANLSYANDHDGRTVPAQINGNWSGGMWFQNEAFLAHLGLPLTDRMWDEDWPKYAKSGHPSASPNLPPGKMDRQASIGINLGVRQHWPNPNGSYNDLSFHINRIKNPSRTMAFADANDVWIRMNRANQWKSDRDSWFSMSIAYRNNGKAAIVFFDGHVELLPRDQVVGNLTLWNPDAP